jgi:hypothetical protein
LGVKLEKPGNHSIFSEISQDVGEINKENKLEIDGQKGFLMRRYAIARASKADFLLKRLNPSDRIHSTSHRRRYYFTAVDIWAWGCIVGEMHLGVSHCLSWGSGSTPNLNELPIQLTSVTANDDFRLMVLNVHYLSTHRVPG